MFIEFLDHRHRFRAVRVVALDEQLAAPAHAHEPHAEIVPPVAHRIGVGRENDRRRDQRRGENGLLEQPSNA
jgi:hypothetical protein